MKRGTINLPLHGGHAPPYLVKRMIKLSSNIIRIFIEEKGTKEFFKKISDPLWFQAFGCVLGFDWHSSGLTTVVTGVLKQAITLDKHSLSISGGKGKKATLPKREIPLLGEKNYNLSTNKINKLLYASKIAAKVDNSAIQDGYTLYHHVILFDKDANWTIIQQGLNKYDKMARRYHWISDNLKDFIIEPHHGIIGTEKIPTVLNMTSELSEDNRRTSLDIARSGTNLIKNSVYKLSGNIYQEKLDKWIRNFESVMSSNSDNFVKTEIFERYEMPRRIDWKTVDRMYEINPRNYEELISIRGVGSATIRALSLIAELIYGDKASWEDPIKYNYAHGGKDGVPYPIARKTYDESIRYLRDAVEGSEITKEERYKALRRLSTYSNFIFKTKDYSFN